jgi:hypothetical protein
MKANYVHSVLLTALISSNAFGAAQIIERGPHHRIIQEDSGARYTELRNGMHYMKNGVWLESQERIRPNAAGAVANEGPYTVQFKSELQADAVIELQTPDGQRVRAQPLGIGYFDAASGKSVLLANVKSSKGVIIPPNRVMYHDAFPCPGTQFTARPFTSGCYD